MLLNVPQQRRRIRVKTSSGIDQLVNSRVLSVGGHMHTVLFQDKQPPIIFHNRTDISIEASSAGKALDSLQLWSIPFPHSWYKSITELHETMQQSVIAVQIYLIMMYCLLHQM